MCFVGLVCTADDLVSAVVVESGISCCPILNMSKPKTGPETRDVIHCFEDGLCLNKPFKPTEDARISDVIFCFADGMCYDDWVIKTDNL